MSELNQEVQFITVDASQMPGYIATNARCRNCNKMILYVDIIDEQTGEQIPLEDGCKCDEPVQLPVYGVKGEMAGKTVAICGAGPSLGAAFKVIRKADHVWGCNRAANWLEDHNWHITHALGIDASAAMFEDAWADPPDPEQGYILATTVDPRLTDHLLEHGRKIRFFHSVRGGFEEEFDLYQALWSPAPICGQGLNVVNRALDLADWLGYKRIYICGADNALGPNDQMYAHGGKPHEEDPLVEGEVLGRKWRTKPDMLMSAVAMARQKWQMGDKVEFVGHTLPRALSLTDEDFLDRCAMWSWEAEERERLKSD